MCSAVQLVLKSRASACPDRCSFASDPCCFSVSAALTEYCSDQMIHGADGATGHAALRESTGPALYIWTADRQRAWTQHSGSHETGACGVANTKVMLSKGQLACLHGSEPARGNAALVLQIAASQQRQTYLIMTCCRLVAAVRIPNSGSDTDRGGAGLKVLALSVCPPQMSIRASLVPVLVQHSQGLCMLACLTSQPLAWPSKKQCVACTFQIQWSTHLGSTPLIQTQKSQPKYIWIWHEMQVYIHAACNVWCYNFSHFYFFHQINSIKWPFCITQSYRQTFLLGDDVFQPQPHDVVTGPFTIHKSATVYDLPCPIAIKLFNISHYII